MPLFYDKPPLMLCRMGLVPCIAVSTGYILLVLFLAELARRLVAPLNAGLVKTALNVR